MSRFYIFPYAANIYRKEIFIKILFVQEYIYIYIYIYIYTLISINNLLTISTFLI